MTRIPRTLLFWTLLLCACAPIIPATDAAPPSAPPTVTFAATTQAFPDSPALPIPKFSGTFETPHIDQPSDGVVTVTPSSPPQCAYQWAQQALPELSAAFEEAIQLMQPEAQAGAFAFGENCIGADGTSTFLPMETDFNITMPVSNLMDESELGEWIVKVMQVIKNIPRDQILGPRPGRVIILFQSNGEQSAASFYIDQYDALPAGLTNAEIYQRLQVPQ